MQRVRMSLPYFKGQGWEAEVVKVNENYSDAVKDPLLLESVPNDIVVHQVVGFSKKWTSKFGLGSIALRTLWFYRKKVNQLLSEKRYDLIYFSTTQFPVCILGAYWKKKYKVPYLIDMQDPWHSDYYRDKPKAERPKKYWFSYRLNRYLEPLAMKHVDGIISVSKNYIDVLQQRYPWLKNKPNKVITFGAFDIDFNIAKQHANELDIVYQPKPKQINLVYVGRGGHDMRDALQILFKSFKSGLQSNEALYKRIHFNFIGTSYAPKGTGVPTIKPIAEECGVASYVSEFTDRIGFFRSIRNLQEADGLVIVGSNDGNYTASKLFPYILTQNHILAVLHANSSAGMILKACNAGQLITLQENSTTGTDTFKNFIEKIINKQPVNTNWKEFEPYTADCLTKKQTDIFNQIITS